ncbi:hypothetical protein EFV80_13135 [Yersinia enterocolitica]|nr:hypothetical protein [Yersinia enterocolitica]EKN6126163.1 hypothetical protein [Yersinia enterocolitica]
MLKDTWESADDWFQA